MTETLAPDDVGGVNVIARADDGRYVLGVDTTWTILGAAPLFVGTHEAAFTCDGPGPIEITAIAGDVTLTRNVWIRP